MFGFVHDGHKSFDWPVGLESNEWEGGSQREEKGSRDGAWASSQSWRRLLNVLAAALAEKA